MQHYEIEITDLAEIDLESIGDYIAFYLKAPETAVNMIQGIRQSVHKLKEYPTRHELDEDRTLADLGIRKHYYKEYKIFYLVDETDKTVIVIRILHMLVDSRTALYRTLELR